MIKLSLTLIIKRDKIIITNNMVITMRNFDYKKENKQLLTPEIGELAFIGSEHQETFADWWEQME